MAKKKSKSTKKNTTTDSPVFSDRKSVEMEKVKNGFIVSSYGENGSTKFIEKTKKAAKARASKMLG